MAGRGLIAPEDASAVNASGVTIQEALVVVVMAIIARLIMTFGGKIFSAHVEERKNGSGAMLLLLGVAGLLGLGLSSCSPEALQAARQVPVKACYIDKNGNKACYSSKGGIEVEVISAK